MNGIREISFIKSVDLVEMVSLGYAQEDVGVELT